MFLSNTDLALNENWKCHDDSQKLEFMNNNFIYVFGENDCVERHKTLHLRYQGPNQIHGQTSSNFGNT